MQQVFLLLAQTEAEKGAGSASNLLTSPLLPMIIMFGLFFFLIILPGQRKEKKQREELMARLKKNDEVITTSGIIGIVVSVKEGADEVTLKSEDTRLRVTKSSIARIVAKEVPKDGPAS